MNGKLTTLLILTILSGAVAKAQQYDNYHVNDGKGKETIGTYYDGHSYKIVIQDGHAVACNVDDKTIAPADYSKYDSIVTRIVKQFRRDEAQAAIDRAQGEKDRIQGEKDREQGERDRIQGEKDREQGDKDRDQAVRDREQAVHDQQQAQHDREQAVRDQEQAQHDREQAARDREEAVRDQEQAKIDREQAVRDRAQAEVDRRQAAEDRENMRRLINLLVDKKLIPDAASLKDLVLTEDELIINGKKASPEMQKEVKQQYAEWARRGLSYGSRSNCCTTIHFHTGSVSVN